MKQYGVFKTDGMNVIGTFYPQSQELRHCSWMDLDKLQADGWRVINTTIQSAPHPRESVAIVYLLERQLP